MISIDECKKRILKELEKRTNKQDMETSSMDDVVREIKIMQQILDDNPSWGYKILIEGQSFQIVNRQ